MKTKQEIIREAYGDIYHHVQNQINPHTGIVRTVGSPKDCGFENRCEIIATFPFEHVWRPIALKGIEDNNGWHVINGPEDLPKVKGTYDVWYRRYDEKTTRSFCPDKEFIDDWLDQFSHWKEIRRLTLS